jgi:excinuclease ABC subunit A
LSGGESQRINLATSLGSTLVGSLYILDEPSVGLHPRDGDRLITILEQLRDLGNTVIVVEHDEALMKRADRILDIGPLAGEHGGKVVAEGTLEDILKNENSLTAKYLSGKEKINVPEQRRTWNNCIRIEGAREHNLKNVTAEIPLNVFTVVTGVSGSGKSTLIRKILYPGLRQYLGENSDKPGKHMRLSGELNRLKGVEMVDQSPIGKSSRSNPVTYLKIYDLIRELFSETPLAKTRNLKPGHFSFNVEGGRCETCHGDGTVTLEMQFLSDIELICESCNGKRFKELILEVKYKNKNISEVLDMTITEAILFFSEEKKIVSKLTIVEEVGLGYIRLGQSSSTFSGGEAQRIKLAAFLQKQAGDGNTLFIFDEPTTGLHFNDVKKLLYALNRLVEEGNTVLVIEHNLDVIKSADYVIDLGPEGGDKGGYLLFEGTPEELVNIEKSYTAKYLKEKLN